MIRNHQKALILKTDQTKAKKKICLVSGNAGGQKNSQTGSSENFFFDEFNLTFSINFTIKYFSTNFLC